MKSKQASKKRWRPSYSSRPTTTTTTTHTPRPVFYGGNSHSAGLRCVMCGAIFHTCCLTHSLSLPSSLPSFVVPCRRRRLGRPISLPCVCGGEERHCADATARQKRRHLEKERVGRSVSPCSCWVCGGGEVYHYEERPTRHLFYGVRMFVSGDRERGVYVRWSVRHVASYRSILLSQSHAVSAPSSSPPRKSRFV